MLRRMAWYRIFSSHDAFRGSCGRCLWSLLSHHVLSLHSVSFLPFRSCVSLASSEILFRDDSTIPRASARVAVYSSTFLPSSRCRTGIRSSLIELLPQLSSNPRVCKVLAVGSLSTHSISHWQAARWPQPLLNFSPSSASFLRTISELVVCVWLLSNTIRDISAVVVSIEGMVNCVPGLFRAAVNFLLSQSEITLLQSPGRRLNYAWNEA